MIFETFFSGECDNGSRPKADMEILAFFQKKYLETEGMFECRWTHKDTTRYDRLLSEMNGAADKWEPEIEGSKELKKLLFLIKGNLFLRKGQSQAEVFHDTGESYKRAAVLLEQVFEPDQYNRYDLLIRLNLGKYFRNIKIRGRRSDFWRALDEFQEVKGAIEGRRRHQALLSKWETCLWLDAKVNIGRSKKYLYELEGAKTCFWETLMLLSAEEQIPHMKDKLEQGGTLSYARNGIRPLELPIRLNLDNQMRDGYLKHALVQLGTVYGKDRDYEAAKVLFEIVLELDPHNVDAKNNMGLYLRKTGTKISLEKAEEQFARLAGNRFATINLLKCRLARGEDIERELEKLLENNPQDLEIQLLRGRYYQKHSQWNGVRGNQEEWMKSQEIFRSIYESSPYIRKGTIGLKAYYNLAQDSIVRKKFHQAVKELERILEECMEVRPDAESGECRSVDMLSEIDLGWCFINTGEYEKAKELYEMLLDEYRDKPYRMKTYKLTSIKNNLGECFLNLGEIERALEQFKEVLELEPNNSSANCFLGQCYLYLAEDPDKAEQWLEASRKRFALAAAADPDNIFINSGWLLARVRLLEMRLWTDKELIKSIEKSLKYSSGAFSIRACFGLVRFVEKRGEVMGEDFRNMSALYRAFARVRLGENEEGYSAFLHFQNNDSFRRLEAELRGRILIHLFLIYEKVLEVKEICRCSLDKGGNIDVPVHYTKICTLKKLLEEHEDKEPKLRLWNTVYMNDSFEGGTFIAMLEAMSRDKEEARELLAGYFHHLKNSSANMVPVNGNVYVTSFSKLKDSIHMWNAYADDAKGCALTFAEDFFDIRDSGKTRTGVSVYSDKDYPLYEVQYIDGTVLEAFGKGETPGGGDGGALKTVCQCLESVWRELCRTEELFGREDGAFGKTEDQSGKIRLWKDAENECRIFITDCLNEIRFLFKDIEYEHERELRMIQYSRWPEIEEESFEIPRLFVEVEKEIHMKNVCLGKRITRQESNGIVSWLYKTGKVENVKGSERHYQ